MFLIKLTKSKLITSESQVFGLALDIFDGIGKRETCFFLILSPTCWIAIANVKLQIRKHPSLSHTHTHTLCLSLSLSLTHTHSPNTHSLSVSLSLSLSLSLSQQTFPIVINVKRPPFHTNCIIICFSLTVFLNLLEFG